MDVSHIKWFLIHAPPEYSLERAIIPTALSGQNTESNGVLHQRRVSLLEAS